MGESTAKRWDSIRKGGADERSVVVCMKSDGWRVEDALGTVRTPMGIYGGICGAQFAPEKVSSHFSHAHLGKNQNFKVRKYSFRSPLWFTFSSVFGADREARHLSICFSLSRDQPSSEGGLRLDFFPSVVPNPSRSQYKSCEWALSKRLLASRALYCH